MLIINNKRLPEKIRCSGSLKFAVYDFTRTLEYNKEFAKRGLPHIYQFGAGVQELGLEENAVVVK